MGDLNVTSKLTDEKDSKQTIPIKVFKITDIPTVMDRMGWTISARFMRKWFYDSYYEMNKKEKLNKVDMQKIDKKHIIDDIKFEWLYTASQRVGPVIDNFIRNISYVREYNGYLGRKEGMMDQLTNGLIAIIGRLDHMGLVDRKDKTLKTQFLDFSDLSAIELDKKSQFNYVSIGSTLWEKATDKLDDIYGALGSFIVKVAFMNMIIATDKNGFFRLEIRELGLYVRDTYEFMNDGDDQPLGYWGWGGVIKPSIVSEFLERESIKDDGENYYRVTNNSFVKYREKYKSSDRTGDFFVYSEVKKIPVDIIIHLNSVDIEEYISRSK
ncbi:DUF6402 family protein [Yersinia hibernica]|uniref:Uncharacterized protein n=1 Tax=Yersinia hibernica TaxID=2339259 RepID=A0ABX5R401_9GAMM|nr:DUF6402 family protein [Yersinia hibernica]QAX80349.1 hypothetical protein D5F51_18510 [Yersinia hibernica]